MTTGTDQRLHLRRVIHAPRDRVFQAWTQPDQVVQWACPAPGGARRYTSDLRVGGAFRLEMQTPEGAYTAVGVYREVDAPARLVYTWDWEEEDHAVGETVVTVEFHPVEGGTEIRLTHEGFPAAEARDGHTEGWGLCLDHFQGLFA